MNQYFLSFPDEAEAIKQLAKWRGKDEEDNDIWLTGSQDHALYVVGDIFILPDTTKYGETDFPALKAEIVVKISIEEAKKAALVANKIGKVSAEELQAIQDTPVMVKSTGFHVNLTCADKDLPEEVKPYLVNPQFPKVVWL